MNDTAVWRAASFRAPKATFDIISDSRSPSYMYPPVLPSEDGTRAFFVLGTRNTTDVWYNRPSTVYAFDVQNLSIVWSTIINSDTSNFQMANCTDYVWILTQNQTFGYSDTIIRTLHRNNGTWANFSLDTQLSNFVQNIGVANGQFMVLAYGGYLTFGYYNGTTFALDFSIPTSCGTMPYAPFFINSTWYAICGTYVEMWDAVTGSRMAPFIASNSIRCAAVHEGSHNFVLSGGDVVYVGNASGIGQLTNLPGSIGGGGTSACTGARFNWISPGLLPTFDNVRQPHRRRAPVVRRLLQR